MAGDEPAAMLADCIALVGTPDGIEAQPLCAALGLWCFGEYAAACDRKDHATALAMLSQAAIALAETEWFKAIKTFERVTKEELAKRNRAAADKRHAKNRKSKQDAQELWQSRPWRNQADAERKIAQECCITKEAAGRWVREFKRAAIC